MPRAAEVEGRPRGSKGNMSRGVIRVGSSAGMEPMDSQGWAWFGGGRAQTLGSRWASQTKGSLGLLDGSMRGGSRMGFATLEVIRLGAKRGRG